MKGGLLKGFLSEQRARLANRLIPSPYRKGRILDIGCGDDPFFLRNTNFSEKYGLDKRILSGNDPWRKQIRFTLFDIETEDLFPFEDQYFDVVTMLAVFEHIAPLRLPRVLNEIYRILRPGGIYVMSTPALWSDGLLKFMALLGLVSREGMREHKDAYSHPKIREVFQKTEFSKAQLEFGYFEMFMNIWARTKK